MAPQRLKVKKAGSKITREQTIILGNKSITLDHLGPKPQTFHSRTELRAALAKAEVYSPYFSKD